ncbi:GNAT family N-acetyltransferase [Levilactobacillus suantsaii]|uniref:N-acetyltransferase n=1 Tax=Levilactobacillus suantsaii TaxID=2292255 RepID=A0A4Q0VL58_9LACO|nr:GNAT family N-acetyltransferase [Levilactobacillus suantsaii]QMU08179.1 GNAT family N-acetyltransferase [Levilactobacillus suantsaii]RXI79089.1 N-acetyltransferase [Levilactobacillus suantsaii]
MSSFEGYHPLMTPTFRFDWLTQFRLKHVATLTHQGLAETADWLNTVMRQTMSRQALTWGIERRATRKLVGWGGFQAIDLPGHRGDVYLTAPQLPSSEQQEILTRLVKFAQSELEFTTLTLLDDHDLDTTVLTTLGFTPRQNHQWRLKL